MSCLRHRDARRKDRGDGADPGDDLQARRTGRAPGSRGHQRINPRHQKDSRRHHRRRVDQRAHGRRAFHRVRQPDVQRHLAGLADGAAENQERDARRNRHARGRWSEDQCASADCSRQPLPLVVEEQGACLGIEPDHAQQERHVANARRDERLLRRGGRAGL